MPCWRLQQPDGATEQRRVQPLPRRRLLLHRLHRAHQLQQGHLRRVGAEPAVRRLPRGKVPVVLGWHRVHGLRCVPHSFTHPSSIARRSAPFRASQGRATTPQIHSAASLARLASFALLARLWACAARWLIAQRMGVARGPMVIACARWGTTWMRRAACPATRWARIAQRSG